MGVHVTMNYFIGFVIWWIVFGVIWVGIYFFERQTMKLVDMSRKHAQMIMYILCMLSGYLVAFILPLLWELCPEKVAAFSSLVSAIILITVWKISDKIFRHIWRIKNKDTGIVEYNIELSDGERNWCNTISILGMVALGIILKIDNNVWDYLELTSMALSIWLGSYISIQKIQQKDTVKKVWDNWKDEFRVNSMAIPVFGTIFMIVLVCFIALSALEEVRVIFDEITLGFAGGSILFLVVIMFKRKLMRIRKEPDKDVLKRNRIL